MLQVRDPQLEGVEPVPRLGDVVWLDGGHLGRVGGVVGEGRPCKAQPALLEPDRRLGKLWPTGEQVERVAKPRVADEGAIGEPLCDPVRHERGETGTDTTEAAMGRPAGCKVRPRSTIAE